MDVILRLAIGVVILIACILILRVQFEEQGTKYRARMGGN